MALRNPQTTLNQLYAARDAFFAGATVANYSIGDRTITITNLRDLEEQIKTYEQLVMVAMGGDQLANLGGPARGSFGGYGRCP